MVKKCAIETYPCIVGVVMRAAAWCAFRNLETLSALAGNADVTIRSNRTTLSQRNMQSLLRWSIENSSNDADSPSDAPTRSMTELDPGVIDAILGRPDSELMKEALSKAQDTSLDEDARLNALDDLEMVGLPSSYHIALINLHLSSSRTSTMQMVRVCVRASALLMALFRYRETAHVGAAAGLTRLVRRRRESSSAMGNRHGDAEQPQGTVRGTSRLVSSPPRSFVFSRMRAVPRTRTIPDTPSFSLTRLARTRKAQIKGDICALRSAETPRCRS
jgi:hypothetical protein